MRFALSALATVTLLGAWGCAPADRAAQADLVLRGGRVVTVDPQLPEATALAVSDGRIVAVGDDRAIGRRIGPRTRVLELAGRLAIPGLVESHGHLVSLGESLGRLELASARTWDEVVERVAERAATLPAGTWIVGRGWHQEKWDASPEGAIGGFPTREILDRAVPDHPVLLTHSSGHAAIANAAALEAAGIAAGTPDPEGGKIERYPDGRPTGLLHENAEAVVDAARVVGASSEDRRRDLEAAAERALAEAARHGITSFHDAGATFETVEVLDRMAAEGRLPIRVRVMLSETAAELEARGASCRKVDAHDGRLTVRAIKRWADGALGNRGAWMLAPYSDAPGETGIPVTPADELERTARFAAHNGFQLAVHAIGDRANREILDLYARHLPAAGPDPRWRIEHAQHLSPADIPRFAHLGVIAAMQGIHCTSDGPWVPSRIGDRRAEEGAYVWRSLRDSGAVIANGTDVPVEAIDPFANFVALISRRLPGGTAFHPEQALGRGEALEAYTLAGAYASFDERNTGSLTPGKRADIAVLSRDILSVPIEEIPGTAVVWTIVGGTIVHERANGDRP